MFQYLYEWIQNIAFYMILVMVVMQILPNSEYKKYIRFFTGLVLILLLATPVLKLFGMDKSITQLYKSNAYHQELEKIEEATKYLEDVNGLEYLEELEQSQKEAIGVEEIQIGE